MIQRVYDFFMEKVELRRNRKEIFDKVQVGDMLWCSMPLSRKELKRIDASHRVRPYLVVKKERDFLLCYQSSSKDRKRINNYKRYCVDCGKYRNKKTSWIDLTEVKKIKINNIQMEFISLGQIEIKKIEKRICIGQNRGNPELIRFDECIYMEEGDVVVRDNKLYYVYDNDNVSVYCFRIQRKMNGNTKLKTIKINNKTYYTDFKEFVTIKRSEDVKVFDIAYKEEVLSILEQKKLLKAMTYSKVTENIKRDSNKFEIGAVFQYGNSSVMYLYSRSNKCYGVDLLWYSIKTRVFEIKDIQRRRLVGVKDLGEIKKILEFLIDRNVCNRDIDKVYNYVRDLIFSSAY